MWPDLWLQRLGTVWLAKYVPVKFLYIILRLQTLSWAGEVLKCKQLAFHFSWSLMEKCTFIWILQCHSFLSIYNEFLFIFTMKMYLFIRNNMSLMASRLPLMCVSWLDYDWTVVTVWWPITYWQTLIECP